MRIDGGSARESGRSPGRRDHGYPTQLRPSVLEAGAAGAVRVQVFGESYRSWEFRHRRSAPHLRSRSSALMRSRIPVGGLAALTDADMKRVDLSPSAHGSPVLLFGETLESFCSRGAHPRTQTAASDPCATGLDEALRSRLQNCVRMTLRHSRRGPDPSTAASHSDGRRSISLPVACRRLVAQNGTFHLPSADGLPMLTVDAPRVDGSPASLRSLPTRASAAPSPPQRSSAPFPSLWCWTIDGSAEGRVASAECSVPSAEYGVPSAEYARNCKGGGGDGGSGNHPEARDASVRASRRGRGRTARLVQLDTGFRRHDGGAGARCIRRRRRNTRPAGTVVVPSRGFHTPAEFSVASRSARRASRVTIAVTAMVASSPRPSTIQYPVPRSTPAPPARAATSPATLP